MKKFKAKLTGAIVLFIMFMLVPMIVLAVTNENVQIISKTTDEQGNKQYIVYIQELMKTNFASAVSNSENTPEQDLNFVTAQDGEGNYVAQFDANAVTGETTYLYIKYNQENEEKTDVLQLDLSKALDKTDMEYVENTTKRIETETVKDLVEINEEINGVQTKLTVGGLRITDTENATYEYQLMKVNEGTSYSRLVELVDELNSENYNQKDMYSKIQLTSEFYTLYNQLIERATWEAVSNNEIRQPSDAVEGDQYVVLIRKTAEDGTVTTDAKLMLSQITPYEEVEPAREEQVAVQRTSKLPITGDSIVLFVALAMIVIALIIVFVRMKKLNKKEDK